MERRYERICLTGSPLSRIEIRGAGDDAASFARLRMAEILLATVALRVLTGERPRGRESTGRLTVSAAEWLRDLGQFMHSGVDLSELGW